MKKTLIVVAAAALSLVITKKTFRVRLFAGEGSYGAQFDVFPAEEEEPEQTVSREYAEYLRDNHAHDCPCSECEYIFGPHDDDACGMKDS